MADKETAQSVAAEVMGHSGAEMEIAPGGVAMLPSEQIEWETIHEEAPDQLLFEEIGDVYVGIYQGHDIIFDPNLDPDDPNIRPRDTWWVQLKWRDLSGLKVCNAGHDLTVAYVDLIVSEDGMPQEHKDRIPPNTMTRTQLLKMVEVGQPSEMRSFRVDQAKARRADNPGQ